VSAAATEERILEAASSLWHDGGFEAVTTRAVAYRAGVNEVTLFRHFASKEGLLKAMVARAVAGSTPVESEVADSPADLEEDLRRWARAYLDRTLPVGHLILLGLCEARSRPDLGTACLEAPSHLQASLTRHLLALRGAGRLPDAPFSDVARAFYATLFAHVLTGHVREARASEVADVVARVFARAIQGGAVSDPSPQTAGGAPFAP
jgi:AcrR family transcriptional regulator